MTEDLTYRNNFGVVAPMNADWGNHLTLNPCGIRINMRTGEVEIPEGLSLSDASREVWLGLRGVRGIMRSFPDE